MDKTIKPTESVAEVSVGDKKVKARYQKPKLERLGRVVDQTGGLSLPALESGDPQNRHF